MFREMRRYKQLLSEEETIEILKRSTSGVLALSGDNGYPYAVPLSYVYLDGKIIFHGAKTGHKIDAILANEKASFCVIDQDEIIPEKYTTCFRSVIAFGRVHILEEEQEIYKTAFALSEKYHPGFPEAHDKEIKSTFSRLCMMVMTVEHLTGKEGIELTRAREK